MALSFSDKTNVRDLEDATRVQESITSLIQRHPGVALLTNNKNDVVVRLRQNVYEDRLLTANPVDEADRLLSETRARLAFFIHFKVRPLSEANAARYNRDMSPEERFRQDQALQLHLSSIAQDEPDFSPYATVFVLRAAKNARR